MPYWRLSAFYFFYFAALGTLVPYWSLYLKSLGFDAVAIGSLMAILMATKVIGPNVWGWLGDHLGHRMRIIRLASVISLVCFLFMFNQHSFWGIALVMTAFSFFWNASLPQFEVVTLSYLRKDIQRYSRIRLWGSVGFIVAVVIVGALVDQSGAAVILTVILMIYVSITLVSFMVSEPKDQCLLEDSPQSFWQTLRVPSIIVFFIAVFLMQASHGPYYVFYSIYMESWGYSKAFIGQLWALGVLAEVAFFVYAHRALSRYGGKALIAFSLFFAGVRWLLIGYFPEHLVIILVAQLLHAISFGVFHAAAIHLVHHYFTGKYQGRGQALYASISFGAGGAAGSFFSGVGWQQYGPEFTYTIAALVALIGAVISWRLIDHRYDF